MKINGNIIMSVENFKDLKIWQFGMDIAEQCYKLTQHFPKSELYGLTSQIRRASVSIPANIAEGYGREYRNDYVRFLRMAQGSLKELETHLLLAERIDFTTSEAIVPILKKCDECGRMTRALIRKLQEK